MPYMKRNDKLPGHDFKLRYKWILYHISPNTKQRIICLVDNRYVKKIQNNIKNIFRMLNLWSWAKQFIPIIYTLYRENVLCKILWRINCTRTSRLHGRTLFAKKYLSCCWFYSDYKNTGFVINFIIYAGWIQTYNYHEIGESSSNTNLQSYNFDL